MIPDLASRLDAAAVPSVLKYSIETRSFYASMPATPNMNNAFFPLPDLEEAATPARLQELPKLIHSFHLPLLDDKPQDPILERVAATRQEDDSQQAELRLSPVIFPLSTIRICEDAYRPASSVSSEGLWLNAATSTDGDSMKARRSA